MKLFRTLNLICLLWFVVFSSAAHAQSLTDQTIRSFIDSLQALQGMEEEFNGLTDDLAAEEDSAQMPDMSRIFSSSVEKMKGHDMHNRLEEVVQDHGFSSAEQWGQTGDRIFHAWSALEMGEQSGQMNQEMTEAMKEIDNNPNMSEAQKQQMREMMGGAMSAYEQAANAPEEDKRAVRPYMDALRSATNGGDDF